MRVIDRIEETLRSNGPQHDAASRAGITPETLRWWREKGTRAQADLLAGRRRHADLDRHTKRCVELVARIEAAEAEARMLLLGNLASLAQGGIQTVRTVERVSPDGEVIEATVETRELPPDPRAATWLLTHRYQDDFAPRVEITGAGGGPVEVSIRDQLLGAIAAVRDRSTALDVNSRPVDTDADADEIEAGAYDDDSEIDDLDEDPIEAGHIANPAPAPGPQPPPGPAPDAADTLSRHELGPSITSPADDLDVLDARASGYGEARHLGPYPS